MDERVKKIRAKRSRIKLNDKNPFIAVKKMLVIINQEMRAMEKRQNQIINIFKRDFDIQRKKGKDGKIILEIITPDIKRRLEKLYLEDDYMTMKLGNEAHFNALFHYLHSLSEEREEMHQSYIKAKFEVFEVHCSMTLVFLFL